jgi:HD-GYP domain-containing protein (c-di-GMP phosphodiesterase class II)
LNIEGAFDAETLAIVRDHHERLDGSGYPRGLLAAEIPESVRILTICDVYAAITEPRPYGRSYSSEDALVLMAMKRTRLDLRLLRQFTKMTRAALNSKRSNWQERFRLPLAGISTNDCRYLVFQE